MRLAFCLGLALPAPASAEAAASNQRILPEGWVKDSTAWLFESTRPGRGYGYKWWVLSRKGAGAYDAYAALGYGGQRLIVVPELELIAVFTGWNIYGKPELDPQLALDRVLGAVRERPKAR